MSQEMITLVTGLQFSEERLNEIFEVPKTKELLEKLLEQEKETLEALDKRLEEVFKDEIEEKRVSVNYLSIHRIKVTILSRSLERVVSGKPLNQAVQAEIKEQMKEETVFKTVEEAITEIEVEKAIEGMAKFFVEMLS